MGWVLEALDMDCHTSLLMRLHAAVWIEDAVVQLHIYSFNGKVLEVISPAFNFRRIHTKLRP
jgi:hypothetical protein